MVSSNGSQSDPQAQGKDDGSDDKGKQIDPTFFIPTPEETASVLEVVGWTHRFNTLINEGEWRKLDGPWQRYSDTVDARITSDLRRRAPLARPDQIAPRMIAMPSIWRHALRGLNKDKGQMYSPIEYNPNKIGLLDLDRCIQPWFDFFQRRTNPKAANIWHPEVIVKDGTLLMPEDLEQYEADLFHIMPLELAGSRVATRKKFHGNNEKVLIYTTDDDALITHELAAPDVGLFSGHWWAYMKPRGKMPTTVVKKQPQPERDVLDWAAEMTDAIIDADVCGKSINECLVILGQYDTLTDAQKATRSGTVKKQIDHIAYCLREIYGWERNKSNWRHISKWHKPDCDCEST